MASSWKQLLLLLVAIQSISEADIISSPQNNTAEKNKPLYLLTLVPLPAANTCSLGHAGGLNMLSGARIAQDQINNRNDLLPGYQVELIVKNIEACSCSGAGIGLSNLIEHTTSFSSNPVVAITGLVVHHTQCSCLLWLVIVGSIFCSFQQPTHQSFKPRTSTFPTCGTY